ncbi:MAG: CcmD family protein [Cyclobacteriaceae bacterium]
MLLLMLAFSFSTSAQVEMADNFRGEGKIYVVIVIILLILSGFFYLLFKLDKKSKRLEKEITQSRKEE